MNEQRINREITTIHLVIWFCVSFLAGMVPIFGPFFLGILMFNVGARMKFNTTARYSPLLALLSATIAQYAAGYFMSAFHTVAFVQISIFLLAYAGAWCYRWCHTRWSVRKAEAK